MNQSHVLFQQYPLSGEQEISVGRVPTPYHTYNGHGMFIGGFANLDLITHLLENEQVYPIQTVTGKAVIGIWVVDFTEASLGAHHELQFSILVSHEPVSPIEDHPLTLLKALFANPQARMFCYCLWNNTESVVAYNRELLGLDVALTNGTIKYQNNTKSFQFDDEIGNLLFKVQVSVARRTSLGIGWQLASLLGLRNTIQMSTQPYLGAKVVNPISDEFPKNSDAQTFLASDNTIVQFYDTTTDSIQFGQSELTNVNFQPQFVEHFEPFRFVYLHPELP